MPNTAPMLGIAEAAALLGLSRRGTHRLITIGDLPAQKLPGLTGSYVIARADAEDLRDRRAARSALAS